MVDEAHYGQSMAAQRTQALLRLARHPRLRAIWLLTGTPMKNGRPDQLYPLLAAIDHPIARDQRAFEELFCQGHWSEEGGRRRWQAKGASQLEELRRLTRPLVLHRRKQQVLGLPPKQRCLHPIDLQDAESRGLDHRVAQVIDDYRHRVRQGLVRSDAEAFALLTALRRIGAEFKLPFAVQLLDDLRQQAQPVVLFSGFVEPLQLLHQRLGGEVLTGRLKPSDRQAVVDRFQSGKTNLLLATYGAGGLGFTLHRARQVVLLERPGLPGMLIRRRTDAIDWAWMAASPATGCNWVWPINWSMAWWPVRRARLKCCWVSAVSILSVSLCRPCSPAACKTSDEL